MTRLLWKIACLAGLVVVLQAHAIVGGHAVSRRAFEARYGWAVALENPLTGGVCAAALISPTYVVTAAHCTSRYKRVLVGHTLRSEANAVAVADAIRHPRYDQETHAFDIGLIRLAEPVDIEPLPLASRGEYYLLVDVDAQATILGWGRRPDTSSESDKLVAAEVQMRDLQIQGPFLLFQDQAGPCGGDSGGPMVVEGLDRIPVLVGIASQTDGNLCAKGGGMAVYTNVTTLRPFIEQHVEDLL